MILTTETVKTTNVTCEIKGHIRTSKYSIDSSTIKYSIDSSTIDNSTIAIKYLFEQLLLGRFNKMRLWPGCGFGIKCGFGFRFKCFYYFGFGFFILLLVLLPIVKGKCVKIPSGATMGVVGGATCPQRYPFGDRILTQLYESHPITGNVG